MEDKKDSTIKKRRSPNQIEKDLISLHKTILSDKKETLELKQETLTQLNEINKTLLEAEIPSDLKIKLLKIRTVTQTMGHCYGQGPFGAMQETMIQPLFKDDDLFEFKAKLFDLIKSL